VASAQDYTFGYTGFGGPGMIDMPVAQSFADGELGLTLSHSRDTTRYSGNFQITPRLSASFRYSMMYGFNINGDRDNPAVVDFLFDRSFGLHYRLTNEGAIMPSIAVGVNDLLGTGYFGSEYLVATKNLGDQFRATAGIGWGRFAGVGAFDNPLGLIDGSFYERGERDTLGLGGQVDVSRLFRGDAALFGGVEWQATDRLQFTAEYSSDAYPYEDGFIFSRRSPFNFGMAYAVSENLTVEANYLYGSELGVQLSYAINPRDPRYTTGVEPGNGGAKLGHGSGGIVSLRAE
jgi:hypothetical protein